MSFYAQIVPPCMYTKTNESKFLRSHILDFHEWLYLQDEQVDMKCKAADLTKVSVKTESSLKGIGTTTS